MMVFYFVSYQRIFLLDEIYHNHNVLILIRLVDWFR